MGKQLPKKNSERLKEVEGQPKPKVGRPRVEIDWELVEYLCTIQCTPEEIAGALNIHRSTLTDRATLYYKEEFSAVHKRFAENGKASLRRAQWKQSKTNTSMAIWLGKQYLGQRDVDKESPDGS